MLITKIYKQNGIKPIWYSIDISYLTHWYNLSLISHDISDFIRIHHYLILMRRRDIVDIMWRELKEALYFRPWHLFQYQPIILRLTELWPRFAASRQPRETARERPDVALEKKYDLLKSDFMKNLYVKWK